ncbi:MAG: hypothetical protein RIS94_1996 [Pseudomonadota bacterium]
MRLGRNDLCDPVRQRGDPAGLFLDPIELGRQIREIAFVKAICEPDAQVCRRDLDDRQRLPDVMQQLANFQP